MYKELARGLRNVEVVLEEALNGEECLLIKALEGTALKYFLEEHFAESGRQLIDKSSDAEVVVADDGLLRIEDLTDLESDLSLFEGRSQTSDVRNQGADTDGALDVELTCQGLDDGVSELLEVLVGDVLFNFLDDNDIKLSYADNEVLILVREQALENIVSRVVGLGMDLNEEADTSCIDAEVKLASLQVDITRENVVENYVLDEVSAIVFLVVELLNVAEGNRQNRHVSLSSLVIALDKDGILSRALAIERLISIAIHDEGRCRLEEVRRNTASDFANLVEVATSYNNRRFINYADCSADSVMHLVNDTLK